MWDNSINYERGKRCFIYTEWWRNIYPQHASSPNTPPSQSPSPACDHIRSQSASKRKITSASLSTPTQSHITRSSAASISKTPVLVEKLSASKSITHQVVAYGPVSKRQKMASVRSTNKVVWTQPLQIRRFPLLSKKIAAELAGRETVSFDLELAQCLIRERKSTFVSTRVDDEAAQLNDSDINLDPVGKHEARFLSSETLRIRYHLCSRAPRGTFYRPRSSGGDLTTLVNQWRTMLTMQRDAVIPDVRRRLQNVFLGKEFSRILT